MLFDGKQVELGMWDDIADEFVGPDLDHAIITLLRLQQVMDNRYTWLRAHRRRKIEPGDGIVRHRLDLRRDRPVRHRAGHRTANKNCSSPCSATWLPAAAPPPCPSSPPPSGPRVDIIPKSLRDLFGYRAAFRCTSTGSSNIILGDGWSEAGFSATDISPLNPGEAFLIAEGGIPQRIKVAYLSDADIIALADYAAWTRRTLLPATAAGPAIAVA